MFETFVGLIVLSDVFGCFFPCWLLLMVPCFFLCLVIFLFFMLSDPWSFIMWKFSESWKEDEFSGKNIHVLLVNVWETLPVQDPFMVNSHLKSFRPPMWDLAYSYESSRRTFLFQLCSGVWDSQFPLNPFGVPGYDRFLVGLPTLGRASNPIRLW